MAEFSILKNALFLKKIIFLRVDIMKMELQFLPYRLKITPLCFDTMLACVNKRMQSRTSGQLFNVIWGITPPSVTCRVC